MQCSDFGAVKKTQSDAQSRLSGSIQFYTHISSLSVTEAIEFIIPVFVAFPIPVLPLQPLDILCCIPCFCWRFFILSQCLSRPTVFIHPLYMIAASCPSPKNTNKINPAPIMIHLSKATCPFVGMRYIIFHSSGSCMSFQL